jgi:hypothetical protein
VTHHPLLCEISHTTRAFAYKQTHINTMMKLLVLLACCFASASAFVLPISARTLPRSQQQLAKAQDDLSRAEPDSFVSKLSVAVMNSPLNQVQKKFTLF